MIVGVVRHGETDFNKQGLMQGISNRELNDTGRRQCKWLKPELRKIKYDVCFSSPLVRTFETAMILVGEDTIILKDERIIERRLGTFEGKSYELYDHKKYWDYNLNSSDEGVESVQDLLQRAREFVEYLKENFSDKKVLVVTHGAMVKALHHILSNTNLETEQLNMTIKTCHYKIYEI